MDLVKAQRGALYRAVSETIQDAVSQHGRTDEYDLFDEPGGYRRILGASANGDPCPNCTEEAIVKESFLGGAMYYCPNCQEPPPKPVKKKPKRTRAGS